jgi:hypothetical protein
VINNHFEKVRLIAELCKVNKACFGAQRNPDLHIPKSKPATNSTHILEICGHLKTSRRMGETEQTPQDSLVDNYIYNL